MNVLLRWVITLPRAGAGFGVSPPTRFIQMTAPPGPWLPPPAIVPLTIPPAGAGRGAGSAGAVVYVGSGTAFATGGGVLPGVPPARDRASFARGRITLSISGSRPWTRSSASPRPALPS